MQHHANQSYQDDEILSADPLQLVRLLYRGALNEIARARACLATRDIVGRSQAITRAVRILAELALSLNHSQGGTISRSLVELYDYIQRLLVDANCRQADGPLEEAENLMSTLQDAWQRCEPLPQWRPGEQEETAYTPISCAG